MRPVVGHGPVGSRHSGRMVEHGVGRVLSVGDRIRSQSHHITCFTVTRVMHTQSTHYFFFFWPPPCHLYYYFSTSHACMNILSVNITTSPLWPVSWEWTDNLDESRRDQHKSEPICFLSDGMGEDLVRSSWVMDLPMQAGLSRSFVQLWYLSYGLVWVWVWVWSGVVRRRTGFSGFSLDFLRFCFLLSFIYLFSFSFSVVICFVDLV
jgi:hypothetical protein